MALDHGPIRATLDYVLNDRLDVRQLSARPRFSDHSVETYGAVLDLCERLAADKFEPFNRNVDTQEPFMEGDEVRLPAQWL